jgi:hypothetical protein
VIPTTIEFLNPKNPKSKPKKNPLSKIQTQKIYKKTHLNPNPNPNSAFF